MPYHLTDHIYITQFQDELILLDLKQDKYTVCFKEFADLVLQLLEGKVTDPSEDTAIQTLLDDRIVEEKENIYPFYIDKKSTSEGVANVDWRLPLENVRVPFDLEVVKAFLVLLKVNFYIKFRGFYSGIQSIKNAYNPTNSYTLPTQKELRKLANIVNKACLIYPTRTKCLEWAMTFVLLALKRKWKCNLEIGVQNYPFMAHAWIECNGHVVMDEDVLRDELAIILSEPFRKIKA
jgi:hypothetical protein